MTHQLIIIGSGPGGYETAIKAAQNGLSVLIIESDQLGGTCLNHGCIPTKCLCKNAEFIDGLKHADEYGINISNTAFNITQAVERKDKIVNQLASGIETLLKTNNVSIVKGHADFVDSHTVSVGNEQFTAENIIIATGSTTRYLPIPGAQSTNVLTSKEMLHLREVPRKLCIIGGGVIGLEFAAIYNSFGSDVTVIEYCKEILPNFDREVAKRLRTSLKKQGIAFKTGARVDCIEDGEHGKVVTYIEKDVSFHLEADIILMAVGRSPNVQSLNLNAAGITHSDKGISVDENMQTNIPGIYAVGDINGKCQLAHAATFQGYRALNHILKKDDDIDFNIIPAAVFTHPELAMVGPTEEQLTASGLPYTVHKAYYRSNGKALSMGKQAEDGIVKMLVSPDGSILACHIMGEHASDLTHEATLLIKNKNTIRQLGDTIHAHPSLSEIFLSMFH